MCSMITRINISFRDKTVLGKYKIVDFPGTHFKNTENWCLRIFDSFDKGAKFINIQYSYHEDMQVKDNMGDNGDLT